MNIIFFGHAQKNFVEPIFFIVLLWWLFCVIVFCCDAVSLEICIRDELRAVSQDRVTAIEGKYDSEVR